MNGLLENGYFNWLCAKVLTNDDTRIYEQLMEILFKTEFVWVVPEDEHRVSDALELREEYLRETDAPLSVVNGLPCSILEVLIAFSDRAAFQTDIPMSHWFWDFIRNLKLDRFNRISNSDERIIEDILYTFTWRIYEPNGEGGLFPLQHTDIDQREIEIWYQFCEYLAERNLA